MRKLATTALAAACALLAAPALADHHDGPDDMADRAMTKGEEKLAKLLEGREPGEPQSCVTTFRSSENLRVIDGTALVYGRGRTIYVNVPARPETLDDRDLLVIRKFGSTLCRTDMVTTADRINGFYTGNIFLGDFVPYRRVD